MNTVWVSLFLTGSQERIWSRHFNLMVADSNPVTADELPHMAIAFSAAASFPKMMYAIISLILEVKDN